MDWGRGKKRLCVCVCVCERVDVRLSDEPNQMGTLFCFLDAIVGYKRMEMELQDRAITGRTVGQLLHKGWTIAGERRSDCAVVLARGLIAVDGVSQQVECGR
jgi:hypothetical protein